MAEAVRKLETSAKRVEAVSKAASVEYALDIVDLAKRFKRKTNSAKGYTTLKSALFGLLTRKKPQGINYTEVIKGLTLRIPKGASVGIIGRNGSGKSTLLKLITGIYKPDRGRVAVRGRVAALIELGAGFHPDFTGRENLYLGGVMHGLTREQIDERFDEIVDFAELRHVIDDPVRTYSSGMFMRLGFSLAVHTDPDVLLVDEVLAVGDAAFVVKCKERIALLRKQGKTLILVTHDLDAVERWCDEALWIRDGEVGDRGDPRRVIDHYRQFLERGEEREIFEHEERPVAALAVEEEALPEQQRWGSREVEIESVRLCGREGTDHRLFHPDDELSIEIDYLRREAADDVVFGVCINRKDGLVIHGSNTDIERVVVPALSKRGTVRYRIRRLGLLEGAYALDVAVHRADGYPFDYHKNAISFLVRSPYSQIGVVAPEHSWEFLPKGAA